MKKILLINTVFSRKKRLFSEFGPPLGILSIASALSCQGFKVELIDPQIETNYLKKVVSIIKDDILFVGLNTYIGEGLNNCIELTEK